MAVLQQAEVTEKLGQLPGWQLKGDEIEKVYELNGFRGALAFVNHVGNLAEGAQHHPDITINYSKVRLTLSTHSEGGVTQKDLDLAAQIEKLAPK